MVGNFASYDKSAQNKERPMQEAVIPVPFILIAGRIKHAVYTGPSQIPS